MALKGLWSNVEDQILKAAVQKYGVHQWSKVASLIQKKTARQCEIRWKEFLDPTLNFTEFTKEEDERLLELVRTLPNQWRTVAEMMGRPSQQCVERYNFLLESRGVSDTGHNKVDDVLSVNPSLETQQAKPNAEELAEDEREMLAEARARLANTQGKKATRKVRERMLEESKRIAQLQKRRELKQAGIVTSLKKPKKKYATEIDYNADVIYEVVPPVVVYDVSKENERSAKELEDFERNIERRGKRGFVEEEDTKDHAKKKSKVDNDKNKDKNQRKSEVRDNVKPTETALLDDYKKPVLKLSAPTSSKQNDQSVNLSNLREFLSDSFKKLSAPKNDFEIIFDEDIQDISDKDQEVEEEEHEAAEIESPEEKDEKMIELPLESFKTRNVIPIPAMLGAPKDDFDKQFNELIKLSKSDTAHTISVKNFETWTSINKQIENAITIKEIPLHPSARLDTEIDSPSLFNAICRRKERLMRIKSSFDSVTQLIDQDKKDCEQLCQSIPAVRRNSYKYYIRYVMFLREKKAMKERRTWLESFT
ncbi:Cef1p [Nakaseomyces bracarensis]|uniref:Cef1p n=1 Tax=Nakaseomyces bracarensis TaxID=273131 RepID=UPI00387215C6